MATLRICLSQPAEAQIPTFDDEVACCKAIQALRAELRDTLAELGVHVTTRDCENSPEIVELTAAEELNRLEQVAKGHSSGAKKLKSRLEQLDAAKGWMFEANLCLVVPIAKRYLQRGLRLSELIHEANIGLMRAINRFDCRSGNRFSTFGNWWIHHSITRALADSARTVRVPVHIPGLLHSFSHARARPTPEIGVLSAHPGPTASARSNHASN